VPMRLVHGESLDDRQAVRKRAQPLV